MKDTVYRQDAIDAVEHTKTAKSPDGELYVAKINAEMNIQLLPSAQPKPCKDAVSKAEVLETYADLYDVFDDNKEIQNELHKVFDRINELPSAQTEIIKCEDCKHLQKRRSEESAKKFGQIYECERGILMCPSPDDFCSKGKRKNR